MARTARLVWSVDHCLCVPRLDLELRSNVAFTPSPRASEWGHSKVFGSDGEEEDGEGPARCGAVWRDA